MSRRPVDSGWKTRMSPPLALLTVAALTPAEHRVTLNDENVERPRLSGRPDLVGITVKADTFPRACELAAAWQALGVPVVFGGIHPTACPEECAPVADALVIGEAEPVWSTLLADLGGGRLRQRYQAETPVDLDVVPVPRWDLLRAGRYLFTNTLAISRGCPWTCDFCYGSAPNVPRGHRVKPLAGILAEIRSLGTDHVMFIDDNFIGSPERARDVVRALAPLDLTWHAAVSADIGHRLDLLDAMAAAGCRSLFIGFETVNQANLAGCGKLQNRVTAYDATIRAVHARGIMVNASVVFGFDEDGPDVFADTVEWLEQNRVSTMTAHILTPYPGTRLHARLAATGRIRERDPRKYNTSFAVFEPARMTAAEMEAGYRWAYDRFYSWPSILRRWPEGRAQRVAFLEFNLFYRKYGTLTCGVGRLIGPRRLARLARVLAYPARRGHLSGSTCVEPGSGSSSATMRSLIADHWSPPLPAHAHARLVVPPQDLVALRQRRIGHLAD
jgi:radical SAM superfamily enzyme YgiQ (UPF0313 family)